jgi:hypothetical protein
LPGALFGDVTWILAALGFRLYLAVGGRPVAATTSEAEAVILAGRAVGAVMATMLWTCRSSTAILLGGELNGAVSHLRANREGSPRLTLAANRRSVVSGRDRVVGRRERRLPSGVRAAFSCRARGGPLDASVSSPKSLVWFTTMTTPSRLDLARPSPCP